MDLKCIRIYTIIRLRLGLGFIFRCGFGLVCMGGLLGVGVLCVWLKGYWDHIFNYSHT